MPSSSVRKLHAKVRHVSYASSCISGRIKYCIYICSSSRTRKIKSRGAISLRNALPTWAMPNGSFGCIESDTFLKFVKIDPAVSGRRYASDESSSIGPTHVFIIMLYLRGGVSAFCPHDGHLVSINSRV